MPGPTSASPPRRIIRQIKTALTATAAALSLISCQSVRKNQAEEARRDSPPSRSTEKPVEAPTLPVDPQVTYKMAQVETVRAGMTGGGGSEAKVVITGWLHDGATSIREVKQQRDGQTVLLTVITARPRDAMATLALIPFERVVIVDLTGMAAGPVTITANGVTTTLTP